MILVIVCVALVFALIAGIAFLLVVPLLRRNRRAR